MDATKLTAAGLIQVLTEATEHERQQILSLLFNTKALPGTYPPFGPYSPLTPLPCRPMGPFPWPEPVNPYPPYVPPVQPAFPHPTYEPPQIWCSNSHADAVHDAFESALSEPLPLNVEYLSAL